MQLIIHQNTKTLNLNIECIKTPLHLNLNTVIFVYDKRKVNPSTLSNAMEYLSIPMKHNKSIAKNLQEIGFSKPIKMVIKKTNIHIYF